MIERRTPKLARAALSTFVVCALNVVACSPSGSERPAPSPTSNGSPRDSIEQVCQSSSEALVRLDRRLRMSISADTLHAHGAAVAMVTGILTADAERIEAIADQRVDRALLAAWLAELRVAAERGVDAVRASARQDLTGFETGLHEMVEHRRMAAEFAERLGYSECPY